jgi:hypothetical protein
MMIGRAEILAALTNGEQGALPRQYLISKTTPEEKRNEIVNEPAYRALIEEIQDEVIHLLQEPIPDLPYSLFRLFEETGTRLEYEQPYFARRKRVMGLAIAVWLDPDNSAYMEALQEILWAICNEFTWCLPAHLSGTAETGVVVRKSLNTPADEVAIDLFSAETGFALSEISRLLEDYLPTAIRKRIADEVFRRVLFPFAAQRPGMFSWETSTHNWASVCAGSIGSAAIYMLEDNPEELADVLLRVFPVLDCFLQGYEDDGACREGYGYWQYGFGYYTYFADLLYQRTGGAIDLLADEKVHAIARFPLACFLEGRKVVNFSDSAPEAGLFLGLAHFLGGYYPDLPVPESRLRSAYAEDHCGRFAPGVRNLFWFRPEAGQGEPWPLTSIYLEDAEWLISRCEAETGHGTRQMERFAFAAKGGHNDEPHNHNDVGHFILYGGGTSFLADLGSGLYTKSYFREGRYSILCNGSQGHSVPILNGLHQLQGYDRRAEVVKSVTGAEADHFVIELSRAYGSLDLEQLERSFTWKKSGLPELLLEDTFSFSTPPDSLVERFISLTAPTLQGHGIVLLDPEESSPSSNVRLKIVYPADEMELRIVPLVHLAHMGEPVEVYALDFHWIRPVRQMKARFVFTFV